MNAGKSARNRSRKLMWSTNPIRVYGPDVLVVGIPAMGAMIGGVNPLGVLAVVIGIWIYRASVHNSKAEQRAQIRAEARRYRQGYLTERKMAYMLMRLYWRRIFRGEKWVILYDRKVPGSNANIDIIPIGPPGVYNLDVKSRKRKWSFQNENVLYYDNRLVDTSTTLWESSELQKSLNRKFGTGQAPVRSVWGVFGSRLPFRYFPVANVCILPARDVAGFIADKPKMLSNKQVKEVAEYIDRKFPKA